MKKEIWLPLIGYEERYLISDSGRVYNRLKNDYSYLENRGGYMYLSISCNGKKVRFRVHRLVGVLFIPNPESKPQINHINGIKADNRVENLEWSTSKENIRHAVSTGLFMSLKRKAYTDSRRGIHPVYLKGTSLPGKHNGRSKCCYMFNNKKEFVRCYESQNLCGNDLGIKQSLIQRAIVKGYCCGGYYFSYTRHHFDFTAK